MFIFSPEQTIILAKSGDFQLDGNMYIWPTQLGLGLVHSLYYMVLQVSIAQLSCMIFNFHDPLSY